MAEDSDHERTMDSTIEVGAAALPVFQHTIKIPSRIEKSINPATWGGGSDPTVESNEIEIATHIGFYLICAIHEGLIGPDLWAQVASDLQDLDVEIFAKCEIKAMRFFRELLLSNGVYVRDYDKNDSNADRRVGTRVYEALTSKDYHNWTDEEINGNLAKVPFKYYAKNPVFINVIKGLCTDWVKAAPGHTAVLTDSSNPPLTTTTSTPVTTSLLDQCQTPVQTPIQTPQPTTLQTELRKNPRPERESTPLNQDPTKGQQKPTSKQLTDLAKLYDDTMKYSGDMYDVLESKLLIFRDNCEKVDINKYQSVTAFSTMLKGKALQFYYDRLLGCNDNLEILVEKVRKHFETEDLRQAYLTEWRSTTLQHIIAENPTNNIRKNLELLFEKLILIQRALSASAHDTDAVLRDQVISACRGVPECHYAMSLPAKDFEGVCNQLRSSVTLATEAKASVNQFNASNHHTNVQQYWTDRNFKGNGREIKFSRLNKRENRGFQRTSLPPSPKKCYVCGKPGCWSTKHSFDDRQKAYERFKKAYVNKDVSTPAFTHFVAWHEGSEYDNMPAEDSPPNDEIAQYFASLQEDTSDDDASTPSPFTTFTTTSFANTPFNGRKVADNLANNAVFHAITKLDNLAQDTPREEAHVFTLEGRYSATTFQGIMPDTGAAGHSTAGQPQVKALCREMPHLNVDKSTAGVVSIRFGPGDPIDSLGSIAVPTTFGHINFHVMPTNTPFLFCLADMDRMKVKFDNVKNTMVQGNITVPIIRKWGHPWLLLDPERSLASQHLTEVELRRLHRRFGHPSVRRLKTLLERAGHDADIQLLERLAKFCEHCQRYAAKPKRFRFTLSNDVEFNHEIFVDICYLDGNFPVLHIIDAATAFNAARFLADISAKSVWEALRVCWIDVYQGPPDWITHDAGTNFASQEFRQAARTLDITIKEVPIEAHHSIGKVERYHGILRRAYEIIRHEDASIPRDCALQMAIKAINDTAGPDGLVPTLLVFGAYPRISRESAPTPSVAQRANAIHKAMDDLRKAYAKRQILNALTARNGPSTTRTTTLPLQSEVLVYRENKGWRGPYKIVAINGEDLTVDMPRGPRTFRSTSVRPFFHENDENLVVLPSDSTPQDNTDFAPTAPRRPGRPRKGEEVNVRNADEPLRRSNRQRNTVHTFCPEVDPNPTSTLEEAFITNKEHTDHALAVELRANGTITTPGAPFEASTEKEINSLIERGVFEFIMYDHAKHANARIFRSRIVNEVKGKNTDEPYEKSRLVVQGHSDDGKLTILTQAPTIQRASQRLILALAPSLLQSGNSLWLRDITQAYVQSTTHLARDVFAQLPTQLADQYPKGTIMHVVKPLYGIAEAGTHWWATYNRHHRENLQMVTSTYDPCLLISSPSNPDFGCVGMQTDDTLALTDANFSAREEEELAKASFSAKPKQYLTVDQPLTFNGGVATLNEDGTLSLQQKEQGKKLALVNVIAEDAKKHYVEQRARGAYIASICQPEACFDLSIAAQHQDPSTADINALNARLQWQMTSLTRGLTFVPLDLATAKLFVFVDGSFANNADMTSQLGFLITIANERVENDKFTITGNIVHYSSTKSKRVTRSVLASEVYGMVAGVDMTHAISTTLKIITDKLGISTAPTIVCTDSYSLYECLVKLGTTSEKRLMIDIMALRQSYERRELMEIRWINGEDNPADAFTKAKPNPSLERFITANSLSIRMEGWVMRP